MDRSSHRDARSVNRFGAGELYARSALPRGDEIGDLAAAFDDMASHIESLVRSEQRLLADVSHELRTPLARIRVVLELASDSDPERVRAYLGEIAQDLAELETLVDDVLTSARLDATSGRPSVVPMHWTTVRVARLVERTSARFATLHPDRRLGVDADVGLLEIECDATLLRRAIDNLLENAAKHAPAARVTLRVSHDIRGLSIDVLDDGPGMSADAAALVFEPFFREDVSRDRRTGGVGLGLPIVKTIVQAHGGRVTAESAVGKGTKISIVLPTRAP